VSTDHFKNVRFPSVTLYEFMSHEENAGHYHNINIGNTLFECVAKFIYLGTTGLPL